MSGIRLETGEVGGARRARTGDPKGLPPAVGPQHDGLAVDDEVATPAGPRRGLDDPGTRSVISSRLRV